MDIDSGHAFVYTYCEHIGDAAMAEPDQNKDTAPVRLGVREFRGNMTGFLRRARRGSSFLITSHGEVLAEIHPPSKSVRPRQIGRASWRERVCQYVSIPVVGGTL